MKVYVWFQALCTDWRDRHYKVKAILETLGTIEAVQACYEAFLRTLLRERVIRQVPWGEADQVQIWHTYDVPKNRQALIRVFSEDEVFVENLIWEELPGFWSNKGGN